MYFSKNLSLWGSLAFEVILQTSLYAAWSNQRQPKCLLKRLLLRCAPISCCSLFMESGFCSGQLLPSNLLVDRRPSAQTLWQIFLCSILVSERISRSIWRDKTQYWKNLLQTFLWGTQWNCFRHPPPCTQLQLTPQGRTSASCKGHKRPLCFGRPLKSRR